MLDVLANLLPKGRVSTTAEHGYAADYIEGLLFAWLAQQRLQDQLMDTRGITGASQPLLLGNVFASGIKSA